MIDNYILQFLIITDMINNIIFVFDDKKFTDFKIILSLLNKIMIFFLLTNKKYKKIRKKFFLFYLNILF